MTTNATTTTYRRTYFGLWLGSGLLFAAHIAAGYPLSSAWGRPSCSRR